MPTYPPRLPDDFDDDLPTLADDLEDEGSVDDGGLASLFDSPDEEEVDEELDDAMPDDTDAWNLGWGEE